MACGYSAPCHFLNHFRLNVNWTLRNEKQCNFNQNTDLFSQENVFENAVCEMLALRWGFNVYKSIWWLLIWVSVDAIRLCFICFWLFYLFWGINTSARKYRINQLKQVDALQLSRTVRMLIHMYIQERSMQNVFVSLRWSLTVFLQEIILLFGCLLVK